MSSTANYQRLLPRSSSSTAKADDDLDEYVSAEDKRVLPKHRSILFRVSSILAAVLVLVVYTAAVLYYAQEVIHKPYCPRFAATDTVHLWDKVSYKPTEFNPSTPDAADSLLGVPSPELDANWRELLLTFSNRLPESEAQRLGMDADAIPFDDGKGGYVGGIAVVHNLHCITIHKDYYFPGATEKQEAKQKSHLAHCLHHLLSSAKCQADMTPVLLHWTVDDHIPVLNWNGVERSCVDWSGLMDWGNKHSMRNSHSMSSVSRMKHPIYGNFVDENGKFILANHEGVVDFEEFSERPDYQAWAKEQGIGTGKADAEHFLRTHSKQPK
ncbi:hypothetical protein DL766_004722 [Monosporascus sp. MC13-8B]|uniref:Tat pathway signal sequence n=1 Tax=Monosporascus cannonballus TaxID=155416 RepID=A0ABY0H062_9PEZI|nr:hypothetical protein DL762_007115 [Monosporascus cannonballus]RYP01320.1 hypothetical protein DL763_000292 [Monosporascus cannonballus]RYP30774.1 hypothetical protein DL766_004722 [Monosporascus sp. MC13-8B]